MWCRYNQVIRVMSKKLPTLPRGSLSIKCLNLSRDSSIPRQNKTRDKVGIDCILWRVWNFVMSLVWLKFFIETNFLKLIYSQMVKKLVRHIMIKLLWNICTCVYTYGLELFVWIFTCMLSRQTLKLGYLDNLRIFRRGGNFVMLPVWCNHYEIFVRTIFSETLSNR